MPPTNNLALIEIHEMALDFLNGIVALKESSPTLDLQGVLNSLPRSSIELENCIEILCKSVDSLRLDQNHSDFPSQPVQQAGVRREQKRRVNESDDEENNINIPPKASTPSITTKNKRQKRNDDVVDDHLEPDHPNFSTMTNAELIQYCQNEYLTASWRSDRRRSHTKMILLDALREVGVQDYEMLVYPERFKINGNIDL